MQFSRCLRCFPSTYLAEEFRIRRAVFLVAFLRFFICPIDTITFAVANVSGINTFGFIATKLCRVASYVFACRLNVLIAAITTIIFTIATLKRKLEHFKHLLKRKQFCHTYVYLSSMHLGL